MNQGKFAEAEPLYRRALEIFRTSFGPDHPNTLTIKENYDRLRQQLNAQKSEKPSR